MTDLFDSCWDAYETADDHEAGMRAMLRAVADEILEHHHRASAREVAQLLIEAATPEPQEDEPDDWDDHPSLTAQERNPNLR